MNLTQFPKALGPRYAAGPASGLEVFMTYDRQKLSRFKSVAKNDDLWDLSFDSAHVRLAVHAPRQEPLIHGVRWAGLTAGALPDSRPFVV